MRWFGHVVVGCNVTVFALAGCSSSSSVKASTDGGTTSGCASPPVLSDEDFCASCSFGSDVLLGTYVVQAHPDAVTVLSFRGRRPTQK
jgi:hypothetical protein